MAIRPARFVALVCFLASLPCLAGTTTISFQFSVGLLTKNIGQGQLVASDGRAIFTDATNTYLQVGSQVVSSSGDVVATMSLVPETDANTGVGLIMSSGEDLVMAIITSTGVVNLTNGASSSDSLTLDPAVTQTIALEYDAGTGRATLSAVGGGSVYLDQALFGVTSVNLGVLSLGPGQFRAFTATGPDVPDYPPDSDGDGVNDELETNLGTNPLDPGNRPIWKTSAATLHATNGVTVSFPAGCINVDQVNVALGNPSSIPAASVPAPYFLSTAAVEMQPNGTQFLLPVTVTVPYTPSQVQLLSEHLLAPFYFDGSAYANNGIALVSRDLVHHSLTFTTTHFTTFVLAGPLLDTDHDGIADDWEIYYFHDLATADATTDYDGDGILDIDEFRLSGLGLDPRIPDPSLPAAGLGALALAGLGIAVLARNRLRRK